MSVTHDNEDQIYNVHDLIKQSNERLSKVRKGAGLVQVLNRQGPDVKKLFFDARRPHIVNNETCNSEYISSNKQLKTDETQGDKPGLTVRAQSALNIQPSNIPNFFEYEGKTFKTGLAETLFYDEAKKTNPVERYRQIQSAPRPRLRGLSIRQEIGRVTEEQIHKDVMTRIWKEEHNKAMDKLVELQIQQRMQGVTDLEEFPSKRKQDANQKDAKQNTFLTGLIFKNNFLCLGQGKASKDNQNEKENSPSRNKTRKGISKSALRFRKDISPEKVKTNLKKISQHINAFKLDWSSGQPTARIVLKEDNKARNKDSQGLLIEDSRQRSHRIKIKLSARPVSCQEKNSEDVVIRNISSSNTKRLKQRDPVTVNSVDQSLKLFKEEMEFLVKERNMAQQKFYEQTKNDGYNPKVGSDVIKQAFSQKWPLASNAPSLNNSMGGPGDNQDIKEKSSVQIRLRIPQKEVAAIIKSNANRSDNDGYNVPLKKRGGDSGSMTNRVRDKTKDTDGSSTQRVNISYNRIQSLFAASSRYQSVVKEGGSVVSTVQVKPKLQRSKSTSTAKLLL